MNLDKLQRIISQKLFASSCLFNLQLQKGDHWVAINLESIALTIDKIFPDSAINISVCISNNIKLLVVPFAWPFNTFRTWWKIGSIGTSIWITYFCLAILQESKMKLQQQERRNDYATHFASQKIVQLQYHWFPARAICVRPCW